MFLSYILNVIVIDLKYFDTLNLMIYVLAPVRGVFVPLRALALVIHQFTVRAKLFGF